MKARLFVLLIVGCGGTATDDGSDIGTDPAEDGTPGGVDTPFTLPDVRCASEPDAGAAREWNHFGSRAISLGGPKHRGIDLVARSTAETQRITGAISYSTADKALGDEDVDVFACRQDAWQKIGSARTDSEGLFALDLTGSNRLPIGMRDLYVSVAGDRTGAKFLALVAPAETRLMVSDVDGTLTANENAFVQGQVAGGAVAIQPDAPQAYTAATAKGIVLVYLTARGSQYTGATRGWLADNNFPRGPLRLAPTFVTLPGDATVTYKTEALLALADNFALAAGVGNRASDIAAYASAGVAANRIFIKLPEYTDEVSADLAAQKAIGIQTYEELRASYVPGL